MRAALSRIECRLVLNMEQRIRPIAVPRVRASISAIAMFARAQVSALFVARLSYRSAPSAIAAACDSASTFASGAASVGHPARCCTVMLHSAVIHASLSLRHGM